MQISEIQLAPEATIETAERVHIGTVGGMSIDIEREFGGTFVGWLGQEAIELTQAEFDEIRALVVR